MFVQHIDITNIADSQEFMKVCSEHPECKDCPLKDEDVQFQGGMIRCETGRAKGETEC